MPRVRCRHLHGWNALFARRVADPSYDFFCEGPFTPRADLLDELQRRADVLREDEDLVLVHRTELLDLLVHLRAAGDNSAERLLEWVVEAALEKA